MDFVYDRTIDDVLNRTAKGVLNASDLNRIEGNIETISNNIALPFTAKSWDRYGLPRTTADFARIRNGVAAIRSGYGIYPSTPTVPDQPLNTWQKWNDIEHILHDVNEIYEKTMNNYDYCGEVYAGEGIGVL